MGLKAIMNSWGMWAASSGMVLVLLGQAILFIWISFAERERSTCPDKFVSRACGRR